MYQAERSIDDELEITTEEEDNDQPVEYSDEQAVEFVQRLNSNLKETLETSSCLKEYEPEKIHKDDRQYNFNAITLLESLQLDLLERSTTFLSDYLNVLKSENNATISYVTDNIVTSIESIVVRLREEQRSLTQSDMIVIVCWLCAASVWDKPRVVGARSALHALLPLLTEQETRCISDVWLRRASPPALLALSDAARLAPPARGPAPDLASLLLAQTGAEAPSAGGTLQAHRAARLLRAGEDHAIRQLPANSQYTWKAKEIIMEENEEW